MGVLTRVRSLPTMSELAYIAIDTEDPIVPVTDKNELQLNECDLESMTSKTSVEDILTLLQSKRGNHTVHGTNVWALMKAAADARAAVMVDTDVKFATDTTDADEAFQQESDDMWTWEHDEEGDAYQETDEDLWLWQPDEKLETMAYIEESVSAYMWTWEPTEKVRAMETFSETFSPVAVEQRVSDMMWFWQPGKPPVADDKMDTILEEDRGPYGFDQMVCAC